MRASRFKHPKLSDIQAYLNSSPGKRPRLNLDRTPEPAASTYQISGYDYRPAGLDSEPAIATVNNSHQVFTFKGESTEEY